MASPNAFEFDQAILATYLTLNKSHTKSALIGLELNESGEFSPIIRLLGKDFVGIKININDWLKLKSYFPKIDSYFDDNKDDEEKNWVKLECDRFNIFQVYMYNSFIIKFEEAHDASNEKKILPSNFDEKNII